MKTKLTFLSIAIAALLGVGMLMAFKQEDQKKKYLTLSFTTAEKKLIIVDENGKVSESPKKGAQLKSQENFESVTNEINAISSKGYKLINTWAAGSSGYTTIQYIFEKE